MKKKIRSLIKTVFSKKFIKQVILFGIAGVTTSLIDWCVLAFCVRVLHINPIISNVFSFLVSVTYTYWTNSKFVFDFDNSKGKKRVFITFVLLAAVGFGINELVMWIGNNMLGYDPLIVKVAGIALAAIFNFFSRKLLLEKKKAPDEGTEA